MFQNVKYYIGLEFCKNTVLNMLTKNKLRSVRHPPIGDFFAYSLEEFELQYTKIALAFEK